MEIQVHINNDLARIMARVSRDKADEIKVPMVIAFADARGELVHFQRMENALPVSTEIAVNKAYTAAGLRLPTHKVGPLTQSGQPLSGLELTNQGKMVVFGGGFPLCLKGRVVGAVGVSGGSVQEDMTVAKAVVQALDQMEELACALGPLFPEGLKDLSALQTRTMPAVTGISPDILEGAFYLIQKQ